MDHAVREIAEIEKTVSQFNEAQIKELRDTQLALMDGGLAEVVFG